MRPAAWLLALLAALPAAAATPTAPLRVMSFNIRYGTAADGDNAWPRGQPFRFICEIVCKC